MKQLQERHHQLQEDHEAVARSSPHQQHTLNDYSALNTAQTGKVSKQKAIFRG